MKEIERRVIEMKEIERRVIEMKLVNHMVDFSSRLVILKFD